MYCEQIRTITSVVASITGTVLHKFLSCTTRKIFKNHLELNEQIALTVQSKTEQKV